MSSLNEATFALMNLQSNRKGQINVNLKREAAHQSRGVFNIKLKGRLSFLSFLPVCLDQAL